MLFYIILLICLIALIWSVLMNGFNSIIIMFVRFWPCRWDERFSLRKVSLWANEVSWCQCDVLSAKLWGKRRKFPCRALLRRCDLFLTVSPTYWPYLWPCLQRHQKPRRKIHALGRKKKIQKRQPFKHLPESLPLTRAVGDYSIQRELCFKGSLKNNCPWWGKTVTLSTRTKPDLKWVVCLWIEGK